MNFFTIFHQWPTNSLGGWKKTLLNLVKKMTWHSVSRVLEGLNSSLSSLFGPPTPPFSHYITTLFSLFHFKHFQYQLAPALSLLKLLAFFSILLRKWRWEEAMRRRRWKSRRRRCHAGGLEGILNNRKEGYTLSEDA